MILRIDRKRLIWPREIRIINGVPIFLCKRACNAEALTEGLSCRRIYFKVCKCRICAHQKDQSSQKTGLRVSLPLDLTWYLLFRNRCYSKHNTLLWTLYRCADCNVTHSSHAQLLGSYSDAT